MGAVLTSLPSATFSGSCPRRRTRRRNTAAESLRAKALWRRTIDTLKALLLRRQAWAAEGERLKEWAPLFTHLVRVRGTLTFKRAKRPGQ
jgi:hypothetical protein